MLKGIIVGILLVLTVSGAEAKEPPEDLVALVCQEQYEWDCQTAMNIVACESSWRPWVVSYTDDWGLFQVNGYWHGWRVGHNLEALLDPVVNVAVAYDIYRDWQGWGAWSCWAILYSRS